MAINDNSNSSRLSLSSVALRNNLAARNLYAPDTQYPLINVNNTDRVVGAISTVLDGIAPFKSFDLKNSVIGRLVTTPTPLSEIGLVMLGKQMLLNSMSHLSQQTFPTIKLANLFDGSKNTKLFTPKINFKITKVAAQTSFQSFLENVTNFYPNKDYPFTKTSTNSDFIRNTGTGQLTHLYQLINQNIYYQDDQTLTTYAGVAQTKLMPRSSLLSLPNTKYFDFDNMKFNPYLQMALAFNSNSINAANKSMINSMNYEGTITPEYAPNRFFVETNFGRTTKIDINRTWQSNSPNLWIDTNKEFADDTLQGTNKLVWGRDGISEAANARIADLRGDLDNFTIGSVSGYNIKSGLLEYTRNLINATDGKIGDITRKAFTSGSNIEGFNGSGLWTANNSKYANDAQIANKHGVRQSNVVDQYDRFAKAIRFNGNKVYGGNENSVIYKSVLPRIHPTIDMETGVINNKNMMFSIENLAVQVISKENYGIIDDEFGSPIPLCEVGPFNGRIMWFPPYNLNINESSSAKFEPTIMIGRNEPMYNYMNSERSATLSFTLLVDYPQHLRNYIGQNKQKEIAEFFAFGGDQYTDKFITIENFQAKETQLQSEIEVIKGKTTVAEPQQILPETIRVVFPNDVPKVSDNLNTIFDDLYKKYHYEIIQGLPSSDGTSWGLNSKVFYVTGLVSTPTPSGETFIVNFSGSQYNQTGQTDQFGNTSDLNAALFNTFNDEANRPLYSVYIHGAASKLYTPTNPNDTVAGSNYNKALGQRRAEATKALIEKRLQTMFGKSPTELGIEVTWDIVLGESIGDVQASDSNATKEAIPDYDTKTERHALIEIKRNSIMPAPKPAQLSNNDLLAIEAKTKEIEAIHTKIRMLKNANSCVMNERGSVDANGAGDTGILHGFQAVSGNYFYPAFHSQTPEDFHKRLTFLHQCQRQGAAKSYETVDKNGNLRAKNSVFGRQPICILRIGDFFYTKVIIENYTVDYTDAPWDMNPEGFGMQPMLANVTLQLKVIGGQSLIGPIDALQNAVSFNYYANSTFTNAGMYKLPSDQADIQKSFMKGVLSTQIQQLSDAYDQKIKLKK